MKTIDLTRLERRFIVPEEEAASLLKCFNQILTKLQFSDICAMFDKTKMEAKLC